MSDRQEGDIRHSDGVLDCPVDGCDAVVVGDYDDLLDHVRGEHSLRRIVIDEETGETVLDRIKEARKEALKQDIRHHFKENDTP